MLHSWQPRTNHNTHMLPNCSLTAALPMKIWQVSDNLHMLSGMTLPMPTTPSHTTVSTFPVWPTKPLARYHRLPHVPPPPPQKQSTSTRAILAPTATSPPFYNRAAYCPASSTLMPIRAFLPKPHASLTRHSTTTTNKPAYYTTHGNSQRTPTRSCSISWPGAGEQNSQVAVKPKLCTSYNKSMAQSATPRHDAG